MTSPFGIHEACAYEWSRTDLLEKAYEAKDDPVRRMKYICAFVISGLHQCPVRCRSRPPFNPIIGETYQATQKNGYKIYMEQTEHHPPSFNYLLNSPENNFTLFGFGTINAHLNGLNSILGERVGKNIIKFKDGGFYSFSNIKSRINGVIMGERTYNYYGELVIKDFNNKIECIYKFNDESSGQGLLSKMFFGKEKINYDEGKITIKSAKDNKILSEGYASWLGEVKFDDEVLWSVFEDEIKWTQQGLDYLLPSDSMYRQDLICVINDNYEDAQSFKEQLEQKQRDDQKLREKYSNK